MSEGAQLLVLEEVIAVTFKDMVHDADDFVEIAGLDVVPGAYDFGGDFEKCPVLVNLDVAVRDSMLPEKTVKAAKLSGR